MSELGTLSKAQKMAPTKESKPKKPHTPRNYVLAGSGVYRYSRARMYKRRHVYMLKNKKPKSKAMKKSAPMIIKKQIGGEKNGGTRTVPVHRSPRSYPTQERGHKLPTRKNAFSEHKRHLRSSIKPGTVLIMVAGRHKGKRVVFLKQLASGLLLVTGPFKLNRCPLRRINQIYVIATKTQLDIKDVKVAEKLNDEYFRRKSFRKPKHTEGEIFDTKKEEYKVTDERKKDQVEIDTQILAAIRKNPEKKTLFAYIGSLFFLKNRQFPHKMIF